MFITGNTTNRNDTGEKGKNKSFMESVTIPSTVQIFILCYINNNYTRQVLFYYCVANEKIEPQCH